MDWKLNPKTGQMEPTVSPSKEIEKALIPMRDIPRNWIAVKTVKDGVKICSNYHTCLAMEFKNQWRLLGIIKSMSTIEKHLRGPLVNFHDAWFRGTPIDEPKFNND